MPRRGVLGRRQVLMVAGGVVGGVILALGGNSTAQADTPTSDIGAHVITPLSPHPTASTALSPLGSSAFVIEAIDYGYRMMGSVPGGVTTVQLKNSGKEHHEAQLIRINDGTPLDQALAALKQDGDTPPSFVTLEGGIGETLPGRTSTVILNLAEGQYIVACFVDSPDGQSHVTKGMYLPFKVVGHSSTASLPAGNGTIMLGSGTIALPSILAAGQATYQVTNTGKNPHFFFYGRIPADKTLNDVAQALMAPNPPSWFEPAGGFDALKPGGSGAVVLDLSPGTYVALDVSFAEGDQPVATIFTVH